MPFGTGVALTLDESALLLKLDDVYWTEEGIVSVQITLASLAAALGGRARPAALRRGEARACYEGSPRRPRRPAARGATCSGPSRVQMICSRPGPTPTSTIGTPTASAMKSQVVAGRGRQVARGAALA